MASPEEMAKLAFEVKQKTSDLQAFMRDLDNWTADIEKKDNQLRRAKGAVVQDETKSSSKRKIVPKPPEEPTKQPKEQKIRSHEYDRWSKFNVEKALAELDEKDRSEEDEDEEDDFLQESRLLQQATVEKERGNDYFRAGNYDSAIERYTRGIECDPNNAVLPANRAMALMKKSQFAAAETDCNLAIELDPTYIKAFQRRATCRAKLKNYAGAKDDYERVLELEPGNKLAKAELKKMEEMMEKSSSVSKADSFGENMKAAFAASKTPTTNEQKLEPGVILPVKKLPHQRSKKPLRRIQVQEVGDVDVVVQETQRAEVNNHQTETRHTWADDGHDHDGFHEQLVKYPY